MAKISYKDAGVDLEKYQDSMARLPSLMHRTFGPRVVRQDGGFAGLYQLDFASRLFARDYQDPVLVACTDGVGTKLNVAKRLGVHSTIGQDLVAMCVNDALCCGAEPLLFLDYVAMSEDDPDLLEQIVQGISDGCLQADCALLGGETAIMPGLYGEHDYDLAGFCVGVVERNSVIDGSTITDGDVVIGIESSGLHSNGYSLARKIVFAIAEYNLQETPAGFQQSMGETLLQPTTIYAKAIRAVLSHYKVKSVVHGIAHITGGGLCENIQRITPDHVDIRLAKGSWEAAPIFAWLQDAGNVEESEMYRVFNMGIGMTLIASDYHVRRVIRILESHGLRAWQIGQVTHGTGRVAFED